MPDAVDFMRKTPKPPKHLNKRFCAVLTKDSLRRKQVLICKSLDYESDRERWLDQYEEDNQGDDDDEEDQDDDDDDDEASDDTEPPQHKTLDQTGGNIESYAAQTSKGNARIRIPADSNRRIVQELGNDYEKIQVIPTPKDEVALFQAGFQRYKWLARYRAWREQGYLI